MELTDETPVLTFRSSGLSQKEFCREHNVSLIKLQYHLYRKKKNSTNVKNRFSGADTFDSIPLAGWQKKEIEALHNEDAENLKNLPAENITFIL